jgi:hypothetical protein
MPLVVCGAVLALRLLDAVVADADVDPAVDAHANAVGRVIAAPVGDHVRRQARHEDFLFGGQAVGPLVEDAQGRRVHDPERTVAVDQTARVVGLGEHPDVEVLAVAGLIGHPEDLAAARRAAQRPLLVDADEQIAVGGRGQGDGIVHLRRHGEQGDVELRRCLDLIAEGPFVDRLIRAAPPGRVALRRAEAVELRHETLALARQLGVDRRQTLVDERLQIGRLRAALRTKAERRLLARLGRLFLPSQRLLRRLLDGVDVLQQPLLREDGGRQVLQQFPVLLVDLRDGEQAVRQFAIARIGMRQAQVHQLVRRTHEQEVGLRELQVAGDEDELASLRAEIQVVVVPEAEETLQV